MFPFLNVKQKILTFEEMYVICAVFMELCLVCIIVKKKTKILHSSALKFHTYNITKSNPSTVRYVQLL